MTAKRIIIGAVIITLGVVGGIVGLFLWALTQLEKLEQDV